MNDCSGMDWYNTGAEKREVDGGFAQISVSGLVFSTKFGGGDPLPGTGSSELINLNCDMTLKLKPGGVCQ